MTSPYNIYRGRQPRRGGQPRAYAFAGGLSRASNEPGSGTGYRGRARSPWTRGAGRGGGRGRFFSRDNEGSGAARDQHGPKRGRSHVGSGSRANHGQRISVGDKDRSWNIRSLSLREVIALSTLQPAELVNRLAGDIKALQMTLQQSRKISIPVVMDILVQILSKVADEKGETSRPQALQILAEAFSERCAEFHLQLKLYVVNLKSPAPRNMPPSFPAAQYTPQLNLMRLCKLFRTLLETLSSSTWSCLPVDELLYSVQQLSLQPMSGVSATQLLEAERIVELRDQMRQLNVQEEEAPRQEWDNSEYRKLQILPMWNEVCISDRPCKLRPNIIKGPYKDWLHYYDVQFRLLREDFVAPLRKGVCDYLQGVRGRKLQDVKVYHDVAIIEPIFTKSGICYTLKFDVSHMQHCNWEHSKRLLFGSLLCLSPDNFQRAIFFATVSNREPEMLEKGVLEVQFEEGFRILPFCGQSVRFTMVESLAYFEASRHILRSLQTAEVDTMPFTKYLIQNKCDSVSPPQYLTDLASARYDLNCLYGTERPEGSQDLSFDVCDITEWPSAEEVELDQSQLKAIQMGLTQEIAVIQGPPGTGKTYIGQKIVEALLNNRRLWDPQKESPIVVMCFTNHALDQFLEGITKQPSLRIIDTSHFDDWLDANSALQDRLTGVSKTKCKIVRVGGRCQNELIQRFSIGNIRRSVFLPDHIQHNLRELEEEVKYPNPAFVKRLKQYKAYHSHQSFPGFAELHQVMDNDHWYQFLHGAQTNEEKHRALEIWLGLSEVIEEVIEEPSGIRTEFEDDIEEHTNVAASSNFPPPSESYPPPHFFQNPLKYEKARQPQQFPDEQQGSKNKLDFSQSDLETQYASADIGDEEQEELVDIQGAAAFEEGARMLEADAEYYQKLDMSRFATQTPLFNAPVQVPQWGFYDAQSSVSEETSKQVTINFSIRTTEYAHIIHSWGRSLPEMTTEEAAQVHDIHELLLEDRWRLYNHWVAKFLEEILNENETAFQQHNTLCRRFKEASQQADRYALETADVIGMTTTGAAKYQHILHLVKPRIVIVEEAAEVLESHIVSALNAGTQHLILIGDHKQLRPKPNMYDLAKDFKLDISLFERLVCNSFPHATLQIQHRMRPEIAQLVHPHVYDTLINHNSVLKYENVKGVGKNMFFIQHECPEEEDTNLISHSNPYEVSYIVALCKYLLQQGYEPCQITVLVTYAGQKLNMRKRMPKKDFDGVRISTVDNFQGEENDIILLSLVRSNSEGKVGFLREENRVCVALSRAKVGFYCIGNFKMLREKALIWETVLSDMSSKGYVGDALPVYCQSHKETNCMAKSPQDFTKNAPNGGCTRDCEYRLHCGHVCTLKCHVCDPFHKDFACKKPCAKVCPKEHPCPKKCYEDCGPCKKLVTRPMPECGHLQEMFCYQEPSKVPCKNPCSKKCPSGHPCQILCCRPCQPCRVQVIKTVPGCRHEQVVSCHEDPGNCQVPVEKTLPKCRHVVTLPCHLHPNAVRCEKPCEKKLSCGHFCALKCGEPCDTKPCMIKVTVNLDCEHEKKIACYLSLCTEYLTCERQCERKLPCKHPCHNKCSEPCTKDCKVIVNKVWPCGHKLKRRCYQTQNPTNYPCRKRCEKRLPCGHQCANACGEDCTDKCKVVVDKNYPCGHTNKAPCSLTPPCQLKCNFTLVCGHGCEGKCSTCYRTRIHTPCKFGTKLACFCGHNVSADCLNLQHTHPGKMHCGASCSHTKCSHSCLTNCTPCKEPCAWKCPHYRCKNLCHEMCDRPPCNVRCQALKECGHQCFGVCGEECLTLCPECQPEKFMKKLRCTKEFKREELYIQLACGHIFTVEYMDAFVHPETKGDTLVSPIQCPDPKCKQPISSSLRYGNATKLSLQDINAVRQVVRTQQEQSGGEDEQLIRLKESYYQYMEKRTVSFRDSKQLKQAGWVNRFRGSAEQFYGYKLHPRLTDSLLKLEMSLRGPNVSAQCTYFIQLLTSGIKLLGTIHTHTLKDVSLSELGDNLESVDKQVARFLDVIDFLQEKVKSRLSAQLLEDLQSERYRLTLLVQYCLVKRTEDKSAKPAASASPESTEHFLKLLESDRSLKVSQKEYILHSQLLRETLTKIHSSSLSLFASPHEDISTPPVSKGQWWKCSRGHYYCIPPSRKPTQMHSCPQCVM